jgi:hypothetical protein
MWWTLDIISVDERKPNILAPASFTATIVPSGLVRSTPMEDRA